MINIRLPVSTKKGLKLLCLGAHADDIEIGCGGSLLKMIENYEVEQLSWVVFTSDTVRKREAKNSAKQFISAVKNAEVRVLDFKDGYLPSVWSEVKNEFEQIKEHITPDIILTHFRHDLHQDHRTINELTWNTFRDHLILEYEIPKYDGDLGNPNLFFSLEKKHADKKKEIILKTFKSQHNKHWFDDELLTSMMRLRGVESASESNYAEAFYCRKMVM